MLVGMKMIACLLFLLMTVSCTSTVEDTEVKKARREFLELLEIIPEKKYTKDSLTKEFEKLAAEDRTLLVVDLRTIYSVEIERQKQLEARLQKIRDQFDLRTGAHIKTQFSVQQSIYNPDSFEHESTSYKDMGDHLMVEMKFRMLVAPGVKGLHQIVAKVDLEGNVLDGEITRLKE